MRRETVRSITDRVAQAIYDAAKPWGECYRWSMLNDANPQDFKTMQKYRRLARVAIEATRGDVKRSVDDDPPRLSEARRIRV
jgi:hypothetical protein